MGRICSVRWGKKLFSEKGRENVQDTPGGVKKGEFSQCPRSQKFIRKNIKKDLAAVKRGISSFSLKKPQFSLT